MDTTDNKTLTLDSAVDLLVEQNQPENDSSEDDVEQPDLDSTDEDEEGEVEDVDPDEVEETDEDGEEYEDAEEDAEDSDPDESLHTVKVDGEEKQVSLEELKRGYSGQQYVQKGMQQVAEARKQTEAVYNSLMQERQQLAQLVQVAQSGVMAPPVKPDRQMLKDDPIGYMEASVRYEEQMQEYQQVQAQVQAHLTRQSEAEMQARMAHAQSEAQKLVQLVPELQDAKKALQFKDMVVKTAQDVYGFSPDEIAEIRGHREFLVLRDAMLYRQMQGKKDVVREKAKKARPTIKPGAKKVGTKTDVVRKQRDRLKKTGSISDALSLILET